MSETTKKEKKRPPYEPRAFEFEGAELRGLAAIERLRDEGKLYDLARVGRLTGYCVRYLRRLCHGENGKRLAHVKILGRYYMTPEQVAELVTIAEKRDA